MNVFCLECDKEIKSGYFFLRDDMMACICKDCFSDFGYGSVLNDL